MTALAALEQLVAGPRARALASPGHTRDSAGCASRLGCEAQLFLELYTRAPQTPRGQSQQRSSSWTSPEAGGPTPEELEETARQLCRLAQEASSAAQHRGAQS